jgi:hypothetical protein
MIPRQPLRPNNRSITKLFKKEVVVQQPASYAKDQTSFSYARAGKQNSEGFGGGSRIKGRLH